MMGAPGDGTARAVSAYRLDRASIVGPAAPASGQAPREFESAIRGNSMAPAIPAGAHFRVRLSAEPPCRVGDVIFYLADGGYTAHRVVYRPRKGSDAEYLLAAGDARFAPDAPVPYRQVLGTVVDVQINGQGRPLSAQSAGPWHRRIGRTITLTAMITAMKLSVAVARRLAVSLDAAESRARVVRRRFVLSSTASNSIRRRALWRCRYEATLALGPVKGLLDRAGHPGVTYRKIDVARINVLFPKAWRLEVIDAISDSLGPSDNQDYFRNMSWYNWRHRHLSRRIPALDDLHPPSLAVLDFLAHRVANPDREVLLDYACGIGVLMVYARDLGVSRVHGYDNWTYLARSTSERFLERFGVDPSALVAREGLASLPVTILTCVGFPLTMLAEQSLVWAKPSVRYVLADRIGRPTHLPGFRRTTEYAGLLTVFERVP